MEAQRNPCVLSYLDEVTFQHGTKEAFAPSTTRNRAVVSRLLVESLEHDPCVVVEPSGHTQVQLDVVQAIDSLQQPKQCLQIRERAAAAVDACQVRLWAPQLFQKLPRLSVLLNEANDLLRRLVEHTGTVIIKVTEHHLSTPAGLVSTPANLLADQGASRWSTR